jgi:hypothetical protein
MPETNDKTPEQPPGPSLTWSIKRSLLRYIASMPDGRCSVTDGADVEQAEGTNRFCYEFDSLATETGDLVAKYRGDVRFSGHHGMLFIRLADPEVVIGADRRGTLSVPAEATASAARINLVRFVLENSGHQPGPGLEAYQATSVRLTAEGADVFGGVYGDAEPFDDFNLTLPSTGHANPLT